MLSSTRKRATVLAFNNADEAGHYLVGEDYLYTVIVEVGEGDIIDMVDFKNEFAARTYADSINLQSGEDNA